MSQSSFNEILDRFKSDNNNFALLGILLFHAIIFAVFQIIDKSYQTWDSAGHIGMSYNIAENLKRLLTGNLSYIDFLRTSDYYPPFVQSLGAVVALIFGYSSTLILSLTLIFFLAAIYFVYIDIKLITRNSRLALFAAFLFSMFPEAYEQSRVFHLDLPLVVFILVCIYFLIKSNYFRSTKYALLFALFFSMTQLTKWYGFIYLTVPFLYTFWLAYKHGKLASVKIIKNIGLAALVILAVAVPWYIANYSKLVEYSTIFAGGEIDDPTSFWSFYNFSYYITRILSHQIFLIPFILLIVGLGSLYFKSKKIFVPIALAIIVPLAVFTIVGNKNLRYVFPLAPLFAYVIAEYLYTLSAKLAIVSRPIKMVLVLYLLFAFFFTTFNQITPHSKILKPIGFLLSGQYYEVWMYEPQLFSYNENYWPINEIWDYIRDDSGNFQAGGFGVTPLFDKKDLSLATFELVRREKKFYKAFVPVPYFQFEPFESDFDIIRYYEDNGVKYVLVTSDPGPVGLRNYAVLNQMTRYMLSRRNTTFEMIKTFDLPDGTQLRIFKKLPPGKVIENNVNVACKPDAGINTGIEPIQLKKNHTYVFYTGNFAVNNILGEYQEGKLYIAQIENIPHESVLDVYNLPQVGTSMCVFDDINVDLTDSIVRPLIEPNNCGVDCHTVSLIKWSVGDLDHTENLYTRENVRILLPDAVRKYEEQKALNAEQSQEILEPTEPIEPVEAR